MRSSPSRAKSLVGFGFYPVEKVRKALFKKDKTFLSHFTAGEKKYCLGKKRSAESFAARMAAKLAFWDSLGIQKPERKFTVTEWRQLEVSRKTLGPPSFGVSRSLLRKIALPINIRFLISLTHEKSFAAAILQMEFSSHS